jgi:hypothetical protein
MGRTTKELLNSWQEQETFLFFRTSMKEWKYTSTPPYAFIVAVVSGDIITLPVGE